MATRDGLAGGPGIRLSRATFEEILAHALDGLPEEACGLLAAGPVDPSGADALTDALADPLADALADVGAFYPCRNAARSARIYEVDSRDLGKANWDALNRGMEIVGVYHSHTHTDAYPSPTDVAQASDPSWHYVVVSLRHPEPVMRSYRIVDGAVAEEPVVVGDR